MCENLFNRIKAVKPDCFGAGRRLFGFLVRGWVYGLILLAVVSVSAGSPSSAGAVNGGKHDSTLKVLPGEHGSDQGKSSTKDGSTEAKPVRSSSESEDRKHDARSFEATLSGQGWVDFSGGGFSLKSLNVDFGRFGGLTGRLSVEAGQAPQGKVDARLSKPGELVELFSFLIPEGLRGFCMDGDIRILAEWADDPPRMSAELNCDGARIFRSSDGLDVRFTGNVRWTRALSEDGEFDFRVDGRGDFQWRDIRLAGTRISGNWRREGGETRLERMRLQIEPERVTFKGKPFPLERVDLDTDFQRLENGAVRVRRLIFSEKQLGEIQGAFVVHPRTLEESSGSLRAENLALGRVLRWIAAITGWELGGVEVSGRGDLAVRLMPDRNSRKLSASLRWKDLAFSSADGNLMAEGAQGEISASLGPGTDRPFAIEAKSYRGQLLAGTVFLDLANAPFSFRGAGNLSAQSSMEDFSAELSFEKLIRLNLSRASCGRTPEGLRYSGDLSIKNPDLPKLLDLLVKQPMAISRPGVSELEVGGDLELGCRFQGTPESLRIVGRLDLSNLNASYPASEFSARNLQLELPFHYVFGGSPDEPPELPPERWGRLACDELSVGSQIRMPLRLSVAMVPNLFLVKEDLDLPVMGGKVILSHMVVKEPLSKGYEASMAARIESLDLARFGSASFPLEGTLNGDFPATSLSAKKLQALGRVSGRVFGGELTARNFEIARPLSQGRVLGVEEARLRLADLERMTQALQVGKVLGRVDAQLQGFQMAYGQPAAFQLKVESVPVDDVPRKISLEAVNSISVVGTGSGIGNAGVNIFASFFDEFRYQSIGISCSLKNDVFRVRGLIHDGGVEYLVKRPPLFGINVINRNPDNRISFSDMMERIRRIRSDSKKKGATDEKE